MIDWKREVSLSRCSLIVVVAGGHLGGRGGQIDGMKDVGVCF